MCQHGGNLRNVLDLWRRGNCEKGENHRMRQAIVALYRLLEEQETTGERTCVRRCIRYLEGLPEAGGAQEAETSRLTVGDEVVIRLAAALIASDATLTPAQVANQAYLYAQALLIKRREIREGA